MSAPMFEQVKKSDICKTGSLLKGLNSVIGEAQVNYSSPGKLRNIAGWVS
jgi:hypothetical protein